MSGLCERKCYFETVCVDLGLGLIILKKNKNKFSQFFLN